MIAFILWVVGIVLCVKAILEVSKLSISTAGKAITVILLLVTSWLGLAVIRNCLERRRQGKSSCFKIPTNACRRRCR